MELYNLKAYEIKEKLEKKEIKAVEVVESFIKRINETEERIGSFSSLQKETALKQAEATDLRISRNEKLLPLDGIPVTLKDNMVSNGDLTKAGSKILENYTGIYDGMIAQLMKEKGAVILGKTNMDEFAMGGSTETSYYKKTKNPWNTDYVPGGSSGGAATSVSANQSAISFGSDTGGSIRQPASHCGVVGLKPTYGRVSRYGLIAFASSLDQIGPITKDVKDAAFALQNIAGYDKRDSTSIEVPVDNYLDYLREDVKGLRIGVPKEFFSEELNPEIKEIVENAITSLKELGAEIIDVSLPLTEYAVATYYIIAPAEASSNLARYDGVRYGYRSSNYEDLKDMYIKTRSEGFGDEVKRRIMIGTYVLSAGYYDAYYKKAQQVRKIIKDNFDQVFKEVDLLITPTTPSSAFKLGEKIDDPLQMYLEDMFTIPANMAGIPGISVPAGFSNNMPVGIQLMGKPFDEKTLLRAAYAYEQARGAFPIAKL